MGNSKSINIEEKSNGIFKINVKDNPEYPIAYIRLCWDTKTSKYCIPQDCEVIKKSVVGRKFMVIGMRIPELNKENIYEQVFYLSSGLNSIDSLNKFFKRKFIVESGSEHIWLPFSGFGYDYNDLNYIDDLNTNIKLLKNNFGHGYSSISNDCLYGRFGNYSPNLMQISYCLGADFWKNNMDNTVFNKYNIIKYPTIEFLFKKISCFTSNDKYSNNIDCSVYLNNYIGSALSINYSPELLKNKMIVAKTYTRFSPISELSYYEDIQFDYRIVDILYQHKYYLFQKKGVDSKLPFENTFNLLWKNYFAGISNIYKNNRSLFDISILPILNSIKQDTINNILNEEKEETNLLGTFENPYKS